MDNFIDTLGVMNVDVKEADIVPSGLLHAVMTPQQFQKLQPLLPHRFVGAKGQYIVIELDPAEVQAAADAGVKAPRVKRERSADDRVSSKTVYDILALPDDMNDISYAEYDGEEGYVKINGVRREIMRATAAELYEPGEKSNPEKPVYFMDIVIAGEEEGETISRQVKGYSVMNLIKSLLAIKTAILESAE